MSDVTMGMIAPHAITRPNSKAMPTEIPTSCPAPNSASEKPTSYPDIAPLGADAEIALDFAGDNACRRERGQSRRGDRAIDDGEKPFARLRIAARFARLLPDDQHFRGGHAFGIGQVGMRDERAPQRNRKEHTEYAAGACRRRTTPRTESPSTSR